MSLAPSPEVEFVLRFGAFVGIFAAMALWELAAPARVARLARVARWRTNLGLAACNVLLVRLAMPASAIAVAALAADQGWGLLSRVDLPYWVEAVAAVILLDLVLYFQHVIFHAVPVLSRLHAVHHADPDFDLTTGIRFHPLEMVLSALLKLGAVAAIGAPVAAVLVFEVLVNVSSLFNHANVSLPKVLEGPVRCLLVTPDMHRIHHSVIEAERNSNYGFCLSIWDRLLGTYREGPAGGAAALDIGLAGWRDPRAVATVGGALALPFRAAGAREP